jgi:hypothetical protein
MKSHTGAVMTLGEGGLCAMSTKQKINTKSSTEAELVGVDDAMPNIIWTQHFLKAQGMEIADNLIYQDNQSAILLERNGRRSSGKRTRHIDIRYFFIADRIEKKEVRIEYCPTNDMLADMFTKPLQGGLFRRLRDKVLNIKMGGESIHPASGSQECVGAEHESANGSDPGDGQTCFDGSNDPRANEWIPVRGKRIRRSRTNDSWMVRRERMKDA